MIVRINKFVVFVVDGNGGGGRGSGRLMLNLKWTGYDKVRVKESCERFQSI